MLARAHKDIETTYEGFRNEQQHIKGMRVTAWNLDSFRVEEFRIDVPTAFQAAARFYPHMHPTRARNPTSASIRTSSANHPGLPMGRAMKHNTAVLLLFKAWVMPPQKKSGSGPFAAFLLTT